MAGEDQVDLMEDLITLSVVPNMGVDAQVLIDYANEHLTRMRPRRRMRWLRK